MSLAPVPTLSVVSPVYQAQDCLRELYTRLVAVLEKHFDSFELVLVEDGSPDDSWSVMQELAAKDPRVRGLQLSRNFGQHHALTAGLAAARGKWVVVMDCDLQDRPEDIPALYAKAQEGFDVVLARRAQRKDSWRKRLSSWAFYKVFNYLTDLNYDGTVANFSICARSVVDEVNRLGEATRFFGGFLALVGFKKAFIDVQHDARFSGGTSYTFMKLMRLATNVILAHSNKPLHLCVRAGGLIAAASFLAAIVVLVRAIMYGSPVMGWPTLIVSLYFSTGTIILTLGILGLYIDRVFTEVKHRPVYIVRKRTFDE